MSLCKKQTKCCWSVTAIDRWAPPEVELLAPSGCLDRNIVWKTLARKHSGNNASYGQEMMRNACLDLTDDYICNWPVHKIIGLLTSRSVSTLSDGPRHSPARHCPCLDCIYKTTSSCVSAIIWHGCLIGYFISKSAKYHVLCIELYCTKAECKQNYTSERKWKTIVSLGWRCHILSNH